MSRREVSSGSKAILVGGSRGRSLATSMSIFWLVALFGLRELSSSILRVCDRIELGAACPLLSS